MTTKQARKLLYNLGIRGVITYKTSYSEKIERNFVESINIEQSILPKEAVEPFRELLCSDRHKNLTKFVVSIEYDQKHIAIMANNEPKSKDIAKAIGTSDTCVRTLQSRFINTGLVRPITLDIFEQKINAL